MRKAGVVMTIGAAVIASFITGRLTKVDETSNDLISTRERVTAIESRLDRKDAQDKEFRASLQSSIDKIQREMSAGFMEVRNKLDRQGPAGGDR